MGVLSLSLFRSRARSRVQDHTLGVVQLARHFQETKPRDDECSSRGWIGERADFPSGPLSLSVRGNEKSLVFSKKQKGEKNKRGGREGGGGELEVRGF